MKSLSCIAMILAIIVSAPVYGQAQKILDETDVKGGLVVHIGCGDGTLTTALHANDSYIVHGLDKDPGNVAKARQAVEKAKLSGKVSIDLLAGDKLPFIDNLVKLVVADDLVGISMDEVNRVLSPLGVAYIKGKKTVKPWPKDIDEWTHYLHNPGNNAVAADTVVGPPRHTQWLAAPKWTRNHHKLNSVSAMVTAKGRIFYIFDTATAANMSVPGKWAIFARDAFSGVQLWKKPIRSWTVHSVRFRSGPPQVTRLLAVDGDKLYAPLGLGDPVSQMDAITGKTLKTYEDTKSAEELILVENTMLVLLGNPGPQHAVGHPEFKGKPLAQTRMIVAIDIESGSKKWEWTDGGKMMPETLGSDGKNAYIQVGNGVAALNMESGKIAWTYAMTPKKPTLPKKAAPAKPAKGKKPPRRRGGGSSYGKSTLVVVDDVVLCNLAGQLTAISAEDGKKLWSTKAGGGFHAPLDVFVIDGVVWQGLHVKDSISPPPVNDFNVGMDLKTGKIKSENQVFVDIQTSGHHHRCYREKATSRYIMTGKRGIEMMDLKGKDHSRNNWVRGTCQYGILPANGLIYTPGHSCGCYMESLLKGFWSLAAKQPVVMDKKRVVPDDKRLTKGPAFGKCDGTTGKEDWPLLRGDSLRSGTATTTLPTTLKEEWKVQIGGKLTQPVAASGKVVLAACDTNTVYALDEATGKVVWKFLAGGRVDSPPALYKGMALFGAGDGRVYCLNLADGKLAWTFLAARADIRTVAYERVESVWPVHGSVLIQDGVAYFSAGRSSWIDGGIDLYGLEPATGKIVCWNKFVSRHPVTNENKEKADKAKYVKKVSQNLSDYKTHLQPDLSDSFSMAGGTISDVLVSDGRNVFLHQLMFDSKLKKQDRMSRHIYSTSSLLDEAENHRSHYVLGTGDFSMVPVAYSWIANRKGGGFGTALAAPHGTMLVFNDSGVWGIRRNGYELYERSNKPFSDSEKFLPDFRKLDDQPKWSKKLPARPTAMLKCGDYLIIGVHPKDIKGENPNAAYEGLMGGSVVLVSAKDGSIVSEIKIKSPAVWDGMAAANKKLFISTMDGSIICLGG